MKERVGLPNLVHELFSDKTATISEILKSIPHLFVNSVLSINQNNVIVFPDILKYWSKFCIFSLLPYIPLDLMGDQIV